VRSVVVASAGKQIAGWQKIVANPAQNMLDLQAATTSGYPRPFKIF
jgi:hypothetical protein